MSFNAGTDPATPGKPKPSEKQLELLGAIMQNCQGKLDIDWDEVATQAGYKTAASAREVYRVMAKKFGWNAGTGSTPNNHNNNKAGASGPTPTKVQKNTGKVGTKRRVRPRKELATGNSLLLYSKKQTEEDDDDDEEEDREEEAVKKKIKLEASDGDEPQLPFTHTAGSLGLDDWEDLGV